MNGGQDLGGVQGFGPVQREAGEPVFHQDWERRVFALTLAAAAAGGWNIDMSRHARENRPPQDYLASSYYELWLSGLVTLLCERGLLSPRELETGRPKLPARPAKGFLKRDAVAAVLGRGEPTQRPGEAEPRFAPGDRVRTRNINPKGHTRLPRYARARSGEIARSHGVHVFPDTNAAGKGERPQHLYSVRFDAAELWGDDSETGQDVFLDLWESYLEPA